MALPIDAILPDLIGALHRAGCAVLQAPPGAGKTTGVPLALLDAGFEGKILMLEPRRLAARAAAERLAEQLGERPGATVGYRMRGDSKPGHRIEVVTEGILTRMLQNDPELPGVGTVIFDEFHERSLNADLGLALTWEVKHALRDDLVVLVMSATLDAGPVAQMLDGAPVVTSKGRAFPVETRWLDRPLQKARSAAAFAAQIADLVARAATDADGGILVFLPGAGEIERVKAALQGRLPKDCVVQPLFGALPFAQQRAAIAPLKTGRKVVLATSIAETSLTIEDVSIVVDAGRARRARFDPRSGMSRLVTEPVSQAEADQRQGRAGRTAPGLCYRLWAKAEHGALPRFPPAEIEAADLTGLALELAEWGAEPDALSFLTKPPAKALGEARVLLHDLGALEDGRITPHGTAIAKLPLHPRLAHMLKTAGKTAAPLAAILNDMRGPGPMDLAQVIKDQAGLLRKDIKRLEQQTGPPTELSHAQCAALAYPDRIGLRRKGDDARYILSGGKGAAMENDAPLAAERMIVAIDLDGDTREAKVRLAASISEADVRALYAGKIAWHGSCQWSRRDRKVLARQQEKLGALVLQDRIWKDAPTSAISAAMLDGVRHLGLRPSAAAGRFRARVALLDGLPDMTDDALLGRLEDWLLPYLDGIQTEADWKAFDILNPLRAMLTWDQMQRLDAQAPAHFTTPLGRAIPIDYSGPAPEITLRLQEMFGQTTHPMVGSTPLRVTLLSPGQKPVQTTQDIPGFWATSYADVRRDMRGRYPKHPWPEDPTQADPTLRAKPRK